MRAGGTLLRPHDTRDMPQSACVHYYGDVDALYHGLSDTYSPHANHLGSEAGRAAEDRDQLCVLDRRIVLLLSNSPYRRERIANKPGSVCLTRMVQPVDTIQLDVENLTSSNVDVAIWNIVESEIGLVAANMPLMGRPSDNNHKDSEFARY